MHGEAHTLLCVVSCAAFVTKEADCGADVVGVFDEVVVEEVVARGVVVEDCVEDGVVKGVVVEDCAEDGVVKGVVVEDFVEEAVVDVPGGAA